MSKADATIMAMVEAELEENPEATATELHEKAKTLSAGVRELSLRQFHARYPLQVKRRKARKRTGGRKGGAPGNRTRGRGRKGSKADSRDAVRKVFMDFATDLTARIASDGPHGAVKLLAQVDSYVDRAMDAGRTN
ncbi:MAG: hypothetical protein WEA09_08620 [Gemmatimonadota bacterium]